MKITNKFLLAGLFLGICNQVFAENRTDDLVMRHQMIAGKLTSNPSYLRDRQTLNLINNDTYQQFIQEQVERMNRSGQNIGGFGPDTLLPLLLLKQDELKAIELLIKNKDSYLSLTGKISSLIFGNSSSKELQDLGNLFSDFITPDSINQRLFEARTILTAMQERLCRKDDLAKSRAYETLFLIQKSGGETRSMEHRQETGSVLKAITLLYKYNPTAAGPELKAAFEQLGTKEPEPDYSQYSTTESRMKNNALCNVMSQLLNGFTLMERMLTNAGPITLDMYFKNCTGQGKEALHDYKYYMSDMAMGTEASSHEYYGSMDDNRGSSDVDYGQAFNFG